MNKLLHVHWGKKQEGFTPKKSKDISEQIRRACDKVLERTVKYEEKYDIDGQTNYAKEIENYLAKGGTVKVLPTCIASNTIQFELPNPELDELDKIYNSATIPSVFFSLPLVSRYPLTSR